MLSGVILDLSRKIDTVIKKDKNAEFASSVYLFNALISDLRQWRIDVFVNQDVNDICYLNTSFSANCEQVFGFLSSDNNDLGDMEFF